MGINGSATCVLNFGENGDCYGELVGTVENAGMSQMFRMMNGARIAVGHPGPGGRLERLPERARVREGPQAGRQLHRWKDPKAPRVPIIEHPDVRRMLLELKAHVEGIRALVVKLATHRDQSTSCTAARTTRRPPTTRARSTCSRPLVKAYASDEAFRLCALAIQVYGGAGFLKDWPVEQYTRDAKIFSIYEGTTHIQAMDLVGRKLGQNGGANFQAFMSDIASFVEAHRGARRLRRARCRRSARPPRPVMRWRWACSAGRRAEKLTLVPLQRQPLPQP